MPIHGALSPAILECAMLLTGKFTNALLVVLGVAPQVVAQPTGPSRQVPDHDRIVIAGAGEFRAVWAPYHGVDNL